MTTDDLAVRRPDRLAVAQIRLAIGDEPGEPDEMPGLCASGLEYRGDVRERLTYLSGHAARRDGLGDRVPSDLPGDEDATALGGKAVRVARAHRPVRWTNVRGHSAGLLLAQPKPLELPGVRPRQLLHELDPTRVLVGR